MRVISAVGESFSETALTLPQNSIILWGSATAPAGWEIYSPALGKFVKGAAAGAINTSSLGNATHTHTVPNTNSTGAHTHQVLGFLNGAGGSKDFYGTSNADTAGEGHMHDISHYTQSSGAHTHTNSLEPASSLPTYHRLYWIRATAEAVLPVGGILFYTSASSLTGLQLCNGSNGAPNINGRFIYGASASGDLGATGGVDSHSHTAGVTATDGGHSHVADEGTGGPDSGGRNASTYDGTTASHGGHSHSLTGNTGTANGHSHARSTPGSGTTLPPYINLACLMSLSAEELFANLIIGFVGSSSSLPTGWSLCTGAGSTVNLVDRYIRVVTGTTLGTGGATTHTHSMGTTGSAGAHNHSISYNRGGGSSIKVTVGSGDTAASVTHSHTFGQLYIPQYNTTHTHTIGTTGSTNHEPPHIKIYFIQKQ